MAEAASGRSWAELIDETYGEACVVDSLGYNNHFTQLTSEDPFRYPPDFDGDPSVLQPTDNPNIEGGAYINAPDYAALLLMHLGGGMCGETRVLTQESHDLMHADRIQATYEGNAGAGGGGDGNTGYGMGWWVNRDSGVLSDPGASSWVRMSTLDRASSGPRFDTCAVALYCNPMLCATARGGSTDLHGIRPAEPD